MGASHLVQVRVADYLRLDGGMTAANLSVQVRDVREAGRLLYKGKSLRAIQDGRIEAAIAAEAATLVGRAFAPGARFQPAYDPPGLGQTVVPQPPPQPTTQPELAYNGTGEPGDSIPDREDTRHQAGIPKTGTIRKPEATDRPHRNAGDVPPAPSASPDATPAATRPATLVTPPPPTRPAPPPPTPVASLPPARPAPAIQPRLAVPVPAPAPHTPTSDLVPVGTFYFATGAHVLDDRNAAGVGQLARALAARGDFPIDVEGHADRRGSEGRNLHLSRQRAGAVRDALVAAGLGPRSRYRLRGVSDDLPAVHGSHALAHARNRRTEVLVPRWVLEGLEGGHAAAPVNMSPGLRRLRQILGRIRGEQPPPVESPVQVADQRLPSIRLVPGNSLRIRVRGRDELTRKVRLGQDGAIRYPLVDRVQLAGQTVGEAEQTLKSALERFIKSPEVEVTRVYQVHVFGLVGLQGLQEYDYAPTLDEVLAKARGVDFENAKVTGANILFGNLEARILRDGELEQHDLTGFLRGGQGIEGVVLRDGDQLVIDYARAGAITLVGTVDTSVLYRPGLRLLEAIALAGGIRDEAKQNIKNIRVLRRLEDGKVQRLEVNLHDIIHRGQVNRDIELKPGDYVVVPRRRKRLTVWGGIRELLTAVVPFGISKNLY
jgi:protein involved in polysaccharide export with SLBB domain/outer membrane protein OmpA-like peptidoglycan-associated protein